MPKLLAERASARWFVRPPAPPEAVRELSRALSVPPLLASVLYARGFGEGALAALQPPLTLTQIPDLDVAAARLEHALRHKKRILIHGDYDADGISGTAVLTLGLRALGGQVTPFIPNRLKEGYGVHPERVPEHAEQAELFLTVDCGISNLEEIRRLQAAGVEVIVSDHHQPGPELPACLLVHPKLSPAARLGLPELTGAGVAYHLLWALHERLGLEPPLEYADLATLGIIADVAPLLGENRALVMAGLARMADSKWPGLRAVIRQARIQGTPSAREVAFVLAPRLNAAGRLGEAEAGLELLMTASERRARELAVYLDARNEKRRQIQDEMFAQALELADPEAPALVLEDPRWHPGVMGIVASNLLERFYKPVFIMAQGKGSVRSTPGISAVEGLRAAAEHLLRFGGHTAAAGFAIRPEKLTGFRERIYRFVAAHPPPERQLVADALIARSEIETDLLKAMDGLEPYGEGHGQPLFAFTEALESARAVGKAATTLQLRLGGVKGVAWRLGELAESLDARQPVDVVLSLRENVWNDRRSLEFLAEDVRSSQRLGFAESAALRPPPPVYRGRFAQGAARPGSDARAPRRLERFPLGDDLLELSLPLERLLASGCALHFDLPESELQALEARLADLPSLHDVRRGFVCCQRGHRLPFGPEKNRLVERVLQELELLDARGRPLRGVKRDPYQSETLLNALLERYKLQGFLKAYRQLDDDAFAQAVGILFGTPPMVEPQGSGP